MSAKSLQDLKSEITVDPLARGYSGMSDAAVSVDLKLVNRQGPVTIQRIIKFLMLDETHKTDGTDTQNRPIWRRMKEVVSLAVVPNGGVSDPWGSTSIGNISEIQQIKTHQLVDYFTASAQGNLEIDLQDSKFQIYLAGAESAGCMSTTQKNNFLALVNNRQSRAQELGIPSSEGDIAFARTL